MQFLWFLHGPRNLLYESLRLHCSNMDLRESLWDSAKFFCEGLRVQLATKLFYLETFMVYSIFAVMHTQSNLNAGMPHMYFKSVWTNTVDNWSCLIDNGVGICINIIHS